MYQFYTVNLDRNQSLPSLPTVNDLTIGVCIICGFVAALLVQLGLPILYEICKALAIFALRFSNYFAGIGVVAITVAVMRPFLTSEELFP